MSEGPSPTPVELSILQVVWELGRCTVRQIHDALKPARDTGYSTTLKMVQVMTEKRLLLKDESIRPQVYRPAQPREKTQLRLIDELIQRAFGGSASEMVLRAASAKRISRAELSEIRKVIHRAKGGQP